VKDIALLKNQLLSKYEKIYLKRQENVGKIRMKQKKSSEKLTSALNKQENGKQSNK